MQLNPATRSWRQLLSDQAIRANLSLTLPALAVLAVVSAALRFYNPNWDDGHFFHPDERNIANAVSKVHFVSQLDPEFFAYGGFPIYLYRVAGDLISFFTNDPSWIADWAKINITGRLFSALFSTLTIIPIYALARQLFDRRAALLSAILYAFTVASIQTAHFSVTESLITLVGVLIALVSVLGLKDARRGYPLLLGVIVGIGVASKTSAISFVVMPIVAGLLSLPPIVRRSGLATALATVASDLLVVALSAFSLFALLSPYTFLAFNKFTESMTYESGVATGSLPVVYTLQFDHTLPYLFQLSNLIWQMGPAAIICVAGFIAVLYLTIRTRNAELLVFCVFPLLYFLYVGAWHTKFIRYMVPVIPFLIVSGAALLSWLISKWRLLGSVIAVLVVVVTVSWAIAFASIYTRPQTRIAASEWMYANIAPGSKILGEHWDDGLPVSLGSLEPGRYQIDQLTIYEPDDGRKIAYLSASLGGADYIVLNSRRLYGTLIHLEDKYPITSKYYRLLFEGKLGYEKVAEFVSYPSVLGLTINDDSSEETFQVFDHPKVLIFANVGRYDTDTLAAILNGGPTGVVPPPTASGANLFDGAVGGVPGALQHPSDLGVDRSGNVYVADTANDRIEKYAPDGSLLAIVGGTGNGEGQFREPWGVGVDSAGRVYVADTWNHRVQVFGPNLVFDKKWEGPDPGFYGPRDVAFGSDGGLYVVDAGHGRVVRLAQDASILTYGSPGSGDGQLQDPTSVAASADRVYVADPANGRIVIFDARGEFFANVAVRQWETGRPSPAGLLLSPDGRRLYATSPSSGELLVLDLDGFEIARVALAGRGGRVQPGALAPGPASQLLVLDQAASRVLLEPVP